HSAEIYPHRPSAAAIRRRDGPDGDEAVPAVEARGGIVLTDAETHRGEAARPRLLGERGGQDAADAPAPIIGQDRDAKLRDGRNDEPVAGSVGGKKAIPDNTNRRAFRRLRDHHRVARPTPALDIVGKVRVSEGLLDDFGRALARDP